MNLEVWSGDWGLPSVDSTCLQALALFKMCGAEVQITEANNPLRSPSRNFPLFQDGSTTLTSFDDIMIYLRKKNYNPDYGLSARHCADSLAFTHLLQDRLLPAVWMCWWVDAQNSAEVTRRCYGSRLRFPLGLYYPSRWEQQAARQLAAVCDFDAPPAAIEEYVYRRADECLTSLSQQLGEGDWLLGGGSPSSLDARVFGLLAPLVRAPLPSRRLQTLVQAHANLTRHVARVLQRYFPRLYDGYRSEQRWQAPSGDSDAAAGAATSEEDAEFPHKRRNQLMAAAVAAAAVIAFTLANGLVKIESLESDSYPLADLDAD